MVDYCILWSCLFEMCVSLVFVMSCLYSALSLTQDRDNLWQCMRCGRDCFITRSAGTRAYFANVRVCR